MKSLTDESCQRDLIETNTPKKVPDVEDVTSETTPYSSCPELESLKKERKKLKRREKSET